MSRLALYLLGPPRIELDGEEIHIGRRKALALLAYLAVERSSRSLDVPMSVHSRDTLATLLWPEYDQSRARADLRRTLSLLNRTLGEEWLTADRETVGLRQAPSAGSGQSQPESSGPDVWLDVAQFRQHLAACETHGHAVGEACAECIPPLEEAVGLYRDDFLAGFTLRDSLAFDEWQFFQTQALRDGLAGALERLVRWRGEQGEYEAAIAHARRWLALDLTHEPVHRHLMELYARAGQQAAALRQYQLCKQTLTEELGVHPAPETTALYEQIHAGVLGVAAPPLRTVRGYQLRERIGAGGFGEVYRAYQPSVGREVAIKVILPQYANQPEFVRRFESEAQLVARLEHPHIVPLYDYWRELDGAYLVMRWLRGGNLRQALEQGAWSAEAAARLLEQLAGGLAVAHRQGVVHRDVKPENVLLDEEGNAYLSDFGIAKDLLRVTDLTETGGMRGSLAYIAPEQAQGQRVTAQSDVYSLGVVMHEVLTGAHPFAGVTPADQLVKHLTEPLPPLWERRPDLPAMLEEVIQRATAKDPAERYANVTVFAQAFREALSGAAVDGMPVAPVGVPQTLSQPPAFLDETREAMEAPRGVFVAREAELARLEGYLEAALAGRGQVVFVTGGPGRGKTALMGEFARRAMDTCIDPDLLVAQGTCNAYSGVGDPYLPFGEALGMLTGEVEARWVAGIITRVHARRLWCASPLALQALVDHGPSLIGTLLPGRALLSRALAVAPQGAGWLRELRALSERERSSHSGLEQSALFVQVTHVLGALAAHHPLLLLLDDLQWADSGSVSLLFHLGRQLANAGGRILIICAYRPEEVALGRPIPTLQAARATSSGERERHPLDKVLAEFKRSFGDVWVDLRRADELDGHNFVAAFLDTGPNRLGDRFRRALFEHTGGHPLFTIEVLRAMRERGDLIQDADGRWCEGSALEWERLPARVEAVIAERVDRLDEGLRDVLAVASVEGERFTAQVVAQVQDVPERELLRALSGELAERHHLVREEGETQVDGRFLSRYRFAHALFQEYLYRGLSAGERRLLHGEVAVALEGLYGDRTTEIVVQLAHHYDAAGERDKAVEYLVRAGEQARLAYANEEAIGHYQRALALLGPRSGPPERDEADAWRLEALRGLGLIYYRTGRPEEAEARLQEALALGKEIGLAPRDLVRLYHWLSEVMLWLNRFDEQVRISEEGLALLDDAAASGEAVESVELALMNQAVAVGYWGTEDYKRTREFTYRTAEFLQRLDYCEELQVAYAHVMIWHILDKDVEEAMKWSQALAERAAARHHLTGVAEAHYWAGSALGLRGDILGALSKHRQAAELRTKIGDTRGEGSARLCLAADCLALGKLQEAEEYARRGLEMIETTGHTQEQPWGHLLIGQTCLCQRDPARALDALRRAAQLGGGDDKEPEIVHTLGRAHLAQGNKVQALRRFEEAIALPPREGVWPNKPPAALSGLEQAHEDPHAFRAFCRRLREEQPRSSFFPLAQWFLEPTEPHAFPQEPVHDDFVGSLSPAWVWSDPFGDCSYAARNGLEIRAANERDLWYANLSAPRILRPASGETDWAAQTVCGPISREQPAIGGILLWQDEKNYLRLDRGVAGEHEISFTGCLRNEDAIIGRGRLVVGDSGQVFLRLERAGERVKALCSVEGVEWFTAGEVELPLEGPIQVGLHAIGWIDRTVYHDAYPDGTAIRFESFRLWGVDR